MGSIERWIEANAPGLGLAVLRSLINLERGEVGMVDIDCDGTWIRIQIFPVYRGVLVTELPKVEGEQPWT